MKETLVFLLIGRSGCGKGTQGRLLLNYLKDRGMGETLYIYTGERLRKFSERQDLLAAKITKKKLEKGFIIPSFLAVWIWSGALIEGARENDNIIMDGSPRTLLEATMIDDAMEFYERKNVKPIFIETSEEWSTQRLLERNRSDDALKSIKERFAFFDKEVVPVIDYYKNKSRHKLITVNGEQTIEEVHKEMLKKVINGDNL